ncbi:MAG TPA: SURF1 family protein [Caulobacteraceae bacterium]|jgi:surfeit locus 1 family protein|nr:SURF1 family protein [Caulobacteraceae bacterium]
MTEPFTVPPRRFGFGLAIAVTVAVLVLAGLGTWQLQRLGEKRQLLARIAALRIAPAEPLDVVLRRLSDQIDIDYVRAQVACPALEKLPTVRLYALRDGVVGYRLIAACPVDAAPYRTILVDRGFIPREVVDAPTTPVDLGRPIVGVLRHGDPGTLFTPKNHPERNDWYRRDVPAMTAALHATYPAPIFLMLESPPPHGPGPQPAPLPTDIPNRHFEYALTWYGLALALLGVYIAKLVRDRKA